MKFIIEITNKTNQTIYIDKGNSFRMEADGSYRTYYNTQQITTNQGSGSGAGVNLGAVTNALGIGGVVNTLAGGMNVGGGSQSSVTTTHTDERIIVVPPHAKVQLSKDEAVPVKTSSFSLDQYKMLSFAEDFCNLESIPGLKRGEFRQFTEDDSPMSKRYMLTYALDADFRTIKQLDFKLFVKDAVGIKFLPFSSYEKLKEKYILNETPRTIFTGRELPRTYR